MLRTSWVNGFVDEAVHTVVGVLPPGLQFPLERAPSAGNGAAVTAGPQAFWFPMQVSGEDLASRRSRMFLTVGRLKANVTKEAASAELAALGRSLAADHPETNRGWSFDVVSFRDQVLGRTRDGIPMLAVAVAAVLLAPDNVPFIREARLDGAAVAFTAAVALLTAFVCGVWPALRQSRDRVLEVVGVVKDTRDVWLEAAAAALLSALRVQ